MKLILYIRKHKVAEEEINIPDMGLKFKDRVQLSEELIKIKVRELKNTYAKAIEHYQWEIVLEVESKMSVKFSEEFISKFYKKAV